MSRLKLAWLIPPELTNEMLGRRERRLIEALTDVTWWQADAPPAADAARQALADAQIAVFAWGAPRLTESVLADATQLQRVHYAAGSVKPLVDDALWQRNIRLTSASAALAENVAEFTLAQMILGLYNYFALCDEVQAGRWKRYAEPLGRPRSMIGATIGIVSAGQVGRRVIELLQPFPVTTLLYDPYVEAATAQAWGARKVSFEALLSQSDVVSIHAPNLPELRHLFDAEALGRMKDDAVLINTARGALIDEMALVTELRKGRFFALLDVTDPEPPAADHPLRTLPNVRLAPHIAGGVNTGRRQNGRLVLREIEQDVAGEEPLYEVTKEMLSYIA